MCEPGVWILFGPIIVAGKDEPEEQEAIRIDLQDRHLKVNRCVERVLGTGLADREFDQEAVDMNAGCGRLPDLIERAVERIFASGVSEEKERRDDLCRILVWDLRHLGALED